MRVLIDCDSFWDEYLLAHGEEPPPDALLKTVSAAGEDRQAVRFLRGTPSRTLISVGDVAGSWADYVAGHRAAGQVPDHRSFVAYVCDEHLGKGPLRHHAWDITGVSVFHDGEADTEEARLATEIEEYLRRKYSVGGIDESKASQHFAELSPVLSNADKRDLMRLHYDQSPGTFPGVEQTALGPDAPPPAARADEAQP